jgi:hypothetical protein
MDYKYASNPITVGTTTHTILHSSIQVPITTPG